MMNCPKCNYDIFSTYYEVIETGKKSKYCKIVDVQSGFNGECNETTWYVECICPKCKTKFGFSDSNC